MDRLIGNTAAQRFCDHPDPAVIDHFQLTHQAILVQICEIIGKQTVHMLLQRTDCLHQAALEVVCRYS